MDILKLLQNKNSCLLKLLTYSTQFFNKIESGDFTHLDQFERERGRFFRVFQIYDQKISTLEQSLSSDEINKLSSSAREGIKSALEITFRNKNNTTRALIELDERIIQKIEEEKNKIKNILHHSDKQKQVLQKFKSSWISKSGIELDGVV